MADLIQGAAKDEVMRLSLLHPGEEFEFCSAMGTYDFSWRDEDGKANYYYANHPICKIMDQVVKNYGWGAIPAPVRMFAKDGKVKTVTDW